MSKRVFVISMGMISSIGNNVADCLDSITKLKPGLGAVELFETALKDYPSGEIKFDNESLSELANLDYSPTLTRTTLLAAVAVKQATDVMQIFPLNSVNFGLISGTTVGGMCLSENNYDKYFQNSAIRTHDCGESTRRIAEINRIKGFTSTLSTACSSSANAIMLAARMISNDKLDAAIAGGTDSLSRFTMNGFNSLMILDRKPCRPFDGTRAGINLGEGAAFLILVSEKFITEYNISPICEITGWANTNDAYHQTASSPDGFGAYLAMNEALKKSGKEPKDIDYINAHGTATPNNDLSEGIAIGKLFGESVPHVSSTKPFTGHTLGASGAIEAVLSCLAIKNKTIYPNLNFENKIAELNFKPNTKLLLNKSVRNVMSNSFGFGGNNTSLIFSEC